MENFYDHVIYLDLPYVENLSLLGLMCIDKQVCMMYWPKFPSPFLWEKKSKKWKNSENVQCIRISIQNYPTTVRFSQIGQKILVENACWNTALSIRFDDLTILNLSNHRNDEPKWPTWYSVSPTFWKFDKFRAKIGPNLSNLPNIEAKVYHLGQFGSSFRLFDIFKRGMQEGSNSHHRTYFTLS